MMESFTQDSSNNHINRSKNQKDAIREILSREDYFLKNPPKQPKKEIGDYVESQGILVPKRFKDLETALIFIKQGGEIIIRSEHPDEYNGIAGLLESYSINKSFLEKSKKYFKEHPEIDWENAKYYDLDVQKQIFGNIQNQEELEKLLKKLIEKRSKRYCELLNKDFESFNKEISYSYREKISGANRSIIVDSAREECHHLFTLTKGNNLFGNYTRYNKGNMEINLPMKLSETMEKNLSKDISLYEKIRQLDNFNPNHCPIMEFQVLDDKTFFLQYHRTRDRELSTFILNRALEEGEFEATYVRGTTGPKEIILNAAMYYPEKFNLLDYEDASFDFHYNDIFSDIMSRRRIMDIEKGSLQKIALKVSDGAHIIKSKLFNAQLSIGIPSEKIPEELRKSIYKETEKIGTAARIPIRVISDGRKAYVKLLEKSVIIG